MQIIIGISAVILSFLSGGVYFSKLIASKISKKNICLVSDDSNPGAANVWKLCGKKWGFVAFALDFLKGFIPVTLTVLLFAGNSIWLPFIIVAPVAGSVLGIFNKFNGGKSISVTFGVFAGALPIFFGVIVLILSYLLFSVILKIKPNGVSTIICFFVTAICGLPIAYFQNAIGVGIACVISCAFVIAKHLFQLRTELTLYYKNRSE